MPVETAPSRPASYAADAVWRMREAGAAPGTVLEEYRRKTVEKPESSEAWFAVGCVYLEMEIPERAVPAFETCAMLRGKSVPEVTLEAYFFLEKRAEAKTYALEQASSARDPQFLYDLSEVLAQYGENDLALQILQQLQQAGVQTATVAWGQMHAIMELGGPDALAPYLEKLPAYLAASEEGIPGEYAALLLAEVGQKAAEQKDYKTAIAAFQESCSIWGDFFASLEAPKNPLISFEVNVLLTRIRLLANIGKRNAAVEYALNRVDTASIDTILAVGFKLISPGTLGIAEEVLKTVRRNADRTDSEDLQGIEMARKAKSMIAAIRKMAKKESFPKKSLTETERQLADALLEIESDVGAFLQQVFDTDMAIAAGERPIS